MPLSNDKKIDKEMKLIEFEKIQSKNLADDINKVKKKEENSGRKFPPTDKSEKIIIKNPGPQNTEKNLSEENKRNNMKNFSYHQPQKIAIIKNQAEMKNKNPTLLIIGIMLIIGSVLAIGYWLGKKTATYSNSP